MRLCIVGNGVTRDKAPFADKGALIWTTGSVAQNIPRVDCIFEIHDGVYTAEKLNSYGCVVMMKEETPEITLSRKFPINDLCELFGHVFNGTMTMILAYAWAMGYNEIELYGIDFSSEEEINRRMMFMYVKGRIEGMGGRVLISPGSHLVDVCRTYQYDADDLAYINSTLETASAELIELNATLTQTMQEISYRNGIIRTIGTIKRRNLW